MAVNITAAQVNELRQKSGAGMMDCKNALKETDGDMEKAFDILRKKGAAVAAKRADRTASEGVVYIKTNEDKSVATIIEVNCETDFVGKSDDFLAYANALLEKAYASKANSVEELVAANPDIAEMSNEIIGKVGEKIEVSRVGTVSVEGGLICDYIHPGNKIGAVVVYKNVPAEVKAEFAKLGRDIAIQVAAMKPYAVSRDNMDKTVIEKEIEIYKDQARNEGKPEQILEKIAIGRLDKFYQEACLLEQTFFKDQTNPRQIATLVNDFNKQNSSQIVLDSFLLYLLGSSK
ncbi:MAG: translation elongation factor Ts [Ignavibacteria bacterium]|nr:translation elongation factor Ts [Ignavibacteria bacterium]